MAENSVNALPMEDFSATIDEIENREIPTPPGGKPSLDMLLNVPMRISVEMGRAKMPMKNILQLSQGSVIELDKAAGEPMTIYINGEL
ncbi:MAG: flagellar motor switch protein FliN, partial [Acidithiobacillus ferrivorans]